MTNNRFLSIAFAVTIFLSAFLLFLVQPLISKIILPWFGGSTGVWATCLVFFQSMLCLGYAYAHFLQRLPIHTQRYCHWGLLGLGAVCLPVMPAESWKPLDGNDPAYKIFVILLMKTGLPYLALSATGPLLQAWHARLFPEARTYRLYALSNIASLSSLLLFPLWFERIMTSNGLSSFWSILFVGFVICCGYVAYRVSTTASTGTLGGLLPVAYESSLEQTAVFQAPLPRQYLLWLFLPAFASFMLLAGTNHLCQDIASTPFLWILPLCLYLLSFILCFDASKWYARRFYVVLGLIGLYCVVAMRDLDDAELLSQGWLANAILPFAAPLLQALDWYAPLVSNPATWSTWLEGQVERATFHIDLVGQIFMHCLALFAIFMVCHGELAQRKPPPRYLTAFYLMISIGGALGSALVSLVAPLVFPGLWEWLFGVALSIAIFCGLLFDWKYRDRDRSAFQYQFLYFVIPALMIGGIALWQSSQLPLNLASMLNGSNTNSPSMTSDVDSLEFSEDGEASSDTPAADPLPSHLLKSWVVIAGGGILVLIALFGLREYFRRAPASLFFRRIVVNVAALVISGLYLHDMLQFAPEEIFQGEQEVDIFSTTDTNVWRGRNFYGALTIEQSDDPNFPEASKRSLQHGRITHGSQLLEEPGRSRPTTYYSKLSGVGIAIDHVSQRPKVHLGAIGLGTGTLAAYAAPDFTSGQSSSDSEYELTIYEINPLVVSLSEGKEPWFSYVQDAKKRGAKVEIVLGDARLMMEREADRRFDVLAVDAFSGDSIPIHLLTDEAMKIYTRHLRSDGILAIHISNRYLDLEPICKALANKYGYQARVVEADEEDDEDAYTSTWVLLTLDESLTDQLDDMYYQVRSLSPRAGILWTDAYSSLYEVLINAEADDAIAVIAATHWFQKESSMRPEVELKASSPWFGDGWSYYQTWPMSGDPDENHAMRVRDNLLQVRPFGEAHAAWRLVE